SEPVNNKNRNNMMAANTDNTSVAGSNPEATGILTQNSIHSTESANVAFGVRAVNFVQPAPGHEDRIIRSKTREQRGLALMAEGEPLEEVTSQCRVCGATDVILYQKNTCKPCLVKSFKHLVKVIDHYRAGSHQQTAEARGGTRNDH
ncbi:MAG: hypothetical protein KDK34_07940, partial [Leptospiraceae bacterium]|nr:hypothetical protein [Leptospiraceae bacterium]